MNVTNDFHVVIAFSFTLRNKIEIKFWKILHNCYVWYNRRYLIDQNDRQLGSNIKCNKDENVKIDIKCY